MLESFRSLFSLRWTNEPYFAPLPSQIKRDLISASPTEEGKRLELLSSQPQVSSASTSTTTEISQESKSTRTSQHGRGKKPPAILFVHGGFGSAPMYADFMTYLSKTYDAPTYALSCRGRGASYPLCYLRLVYRTGLDELASDVVTAVNYIHNLPGQKDTDTSGLILVGHSSGGGLIQYALARNIIKPGQVSGIVLLDAIPNFGNLSVYANWASLDPWFSVRMSFAHFNHVASPLSSDRLIKNAFFGKQYAIRDMEESRLRSEAESKSKSPNPTIESNLQQFKKLMAPYESLLWPLGMMKGWWSWLRGQGGEWLDVKDILSGMIVAHDDDDDNNKNNNKIVPSSNHDDDHSKKQDHDQTFEEKQHQQEKVCIIIGSEDKLMDIPNQRRMATQYRNGIKSLIVDKKVNWRCLDGADGRTNGSTVESTVESATDSIDFITKTDANKSTDTIQIENANGVRFVIVNGAGHHVQNDVMWEGVVEQIRRFAMRV